MRETISEVVFVQKDLQIRVEVMRRDFNEHHMTHVPILSNQLGTMQMTEELSEHVGLNYPEITDSRYVAQAVDDFRFHWEEEMGSTDNPYRKK